MQTQKKEGTTVAPESRESHRSIERPPAPLDRRSLNAPNIVTVSRFVLAIILFVLIDRGGAWFTAAVLFALAAATDFLDGYLARKYGQITVLGRILDPFVDKIIICGAFIFLQQKAGSGVTAWMTFTIIAREMFVTSLRAFLEQRGRDFSAQLSGKLKMVVQCVAVACCLLAFSAAFTRQFDARFGTGSLILLRDAALWSAVAVTIYSGLEYTWRAFRMLAVRS